jgi:tetratricopeptide (TPR) repeat protein
MKNRRIFACRASLIFLVFSIALGTNSALAQDQSLPSHPQPPPAASPKLPTAQQAPRTAPSAPSSPAAATVSDQAQPAKDAQGAPIVPAAAERHYHAGRQLEKDNNYDDAIKEYQAAVQEFPDYVDALYRLANLYTDRKAYTQAIAALRQVAMLKPNDANVRNDLGYALKKNGEFKDAAAEYYAAIRLNPKLAVAQNNLANLLYANRQYAAALEHYRAAVQLQPANAETHMNLATCLDVIGRHDDAILEYKEAIRLRPKDANIHFNLAIAYQNAKEPSSAVSELMTTSQLAPDWVAPRLMLVKLLKDSDPKTALDECMIADGLSHDAKLHDQCLELQKRAQ